MYKFSFESDNATSKRVEKFIDKISFSYHINTFDFPTIHGHADYWEFTLLTDGKLVNVSSGKKNRISAVTVLRNACLYLQGGFFAVRYKHARRGAAGETCKERKQWKKEKALDPISDS